MARDGSKEGKMTILLWKIQSIPEIWLQIERKVFRHGTEQRCTALIL